MKLFLRAGISIAFASFTPFAVASPDWTNNGDTNFDNGNNWTTMFSTGTVPGPGDSAHIFPGFTTVANSTNTDINVVQGGAAVITINAAGNENIGSLLVSSNFELITVPGGVLNLNEMGTMTVGSGGVVITGTSTVFLAGNITNSGDFVVGTNNSTIDPDQVAGNGTFALNSGTLNNSAGGGVIFVATGNGVTGSFIQNGTSNVIAGAGIVVGDGGTGNYTLNGNSTLNTSNGTQIVVASGHGLGTMTINNSSSVSLVSGSTTSVGVGASEGIINQVGATSVVTLTGTASVILGSDTDSTGTYNLQGGTLNIGATGADTASFLVGGADGAIGVLNQSGGTLVEKAGSTFTVGDNVDAVGIYTITGGTATFQGGINIDSAGTVNINGGTLTVAEDGIMNVGTINLGGGTLALTSGADTTKSLTIANLTGGTSTIDASAANLTAVDLNQLTSPVGSTVVAGINLVGNGTTVFNFASATGGGANTYTGSTGIFAGTLNATADDFAGFSPGSTLTIGAGATPATLNLSTDANAGDTSTISQAILGTGTLNVNFGAATQTLELASTAGAGSTVNIVLGANSGPTPSTTPGTLQILSGSYGAVTDPSGASDLVIGDGTNAGTVGLGATTIGGTTTVMAKSALIATSLQSPTVTNEGTLDVTNAITGAVTNDGLLNAGGIVGDVANTGTMSVTGAGINGNVISNSGTLAATSALSVMSTGTLATAAPLTNFAVTNDLTSSGTLSIRIAGAQSDSFTANTATLSGTVKVTGASLSTTTPTVYDIVTTAGALNDLGITPQSSFLLTTSLQVVPNGAGNILELSVTTNPFVGSTPNQQALANVLNANPNNPITVAVANDPNLTAADESTVLQSLIPENLQYATFINVENATYLVQRMNGVTADLRNGNGGLDTNAISVNAPGFQSGMGQQLGSMLAYNDPAFHSSAPNGVNYYPGESGRSSRSPSASLNQTEPATFDSSSQVISDSPNPYLADVKPGSSETPRLNEFIGGDVILADLNQNPSANANSKANYTAGGVTAGVSYRVSNHFAAGVLFDYNHTDEDTDNNGGKIKIDSYTPGLFATYFDHGFYANGLFTVGLNDYKYTNDTFLGQTTGSPSGLQYTGNLDAGYDFHPDKNWIVGPTAGLTYTHIDVDSFTEDGPIGAALNVDDQSVDSLRSRLGGHVIFQTNTGDVLLQPNLSVMWQHEFLNDSQGITSSFANTALNPFTINTAAPSRDSALISLGMTATLNNSMALYLNYMADVGASNYFSQSVIGGLKARF